jgi:D-amino-acid dehydrogenase
MKILILGSGLLGVTTAYELGKRGFDVTIIDRQPTAAGETSFANGGQLSYSHAEPWANPSVLSVLPKWMLRSDSPLVFRPRADWQMTKWGLSFLRNCTTHRANINTVSMLRLGLYSRECMRRLREAEPTLEFNHSTKGILHIFDDEKSYAHAKHQMEFQEKFGGVERVITRDELIALEPTLAQTSRTIVGGIHANLDESGDAHAFTNNLLAIAQQKYNVKFKGGVSIEGIETENRKITAIETNEGNITADGFVMALGSYSSVFLRSIGIDVPIYPMKGYSITLDADEYCPEVSLTDGKYKIVYSRLGNKLRIAGTAEFAGYNSDLNERRITPIVNAAKTLFPNINWEQNIGKWACLRPSTPDGPPIIGNTPYKNLFLNTGHGTLGWTQCAGSAKILADIMENKTPEILLHGLTLSRY